MKNKDSRTLESSWRSFQYWSYHSATVRKIALNLKLINPIHNPAKAHQNRS